MKYIILFLFLITSIFTLNCNRSTNNKNQIDDYSDKIESLIATKHPRKFNGVILITQNGKTKYSKEYGYSNFKNRTPIKIGDNFRIQSNSKQVTAVLILKEVEKGTIHLNRTIGDYLPDFKKNWADSVTVHQLLNMSSGIIGLDQALLFKPGTEYKYSNPAYGLLGEILENISGQRYIDLANNLFKDLSMKNTFCYEFGTNPNSLINGYINTDNGYTLVDFYSRGITPKGWLNFIPGGGIISNAFDLNTWDTKLHNGQILKSESYDLMIDFNIRGQHVAFGDKQIGYGYGLRIDDSKHLKIIGHAGKGIGFTNIKFYVPEKKLHVIVLENVYDDDANTVYHFEKEMISLILNSNLVE